MSEYITIDRESLLEHLSDIAQHVSESGMEEAYAECIDEKLSEINGLVHSFDKPVQIEDRSGGYNIIVQSDE